MEATEFFAKVRREVDIQDFHVLRSTGSERRAKINVRMPLGGSQSIVGVPGWVLTARESVMQDRGLHRKVICDLEIEGVTVEFFTTPEAKRRTQILNGATLKQFSVERVGKDEKAEVFLNAICYTPCSEEIVVWLYSHLHESAFVEFDSTQAAFSYDGEKSEDEEDDDQPELPLKVVDPNDTPDKPIPNDKRKVTKPTDKPGTPKRSHKKVVTIQ